MQNDNYLKIQTTKIKPLVRDVIARCGGPSKLKFGKKATQYLITSINQLYTAINQDFEQFIIENYFDGELPDKTVDMFKVKHIRTSKGDKHSETEVKLIVDDDDPIHRFFKYSRFNPHIYDMFLSDADVENRLEGQHEKLMTLRAELNELISERSKLKSEIPNFEFHDCIRQNRLITKANSKITDEKKRRKTRDCKSIEKPDNDRKMSVKARNAKFNKIDNLTKSIHKLNDQIANIIQDDIVKYFFSIFAKHKDVNNTVIFKSFNLSKTVYTKGGKDSTKSTVKISVYDYDNPLKTFAIYSVKVLYSIIYIILHQISKSNRVTITMDDIEIGLLACGLSEILDESKLAKLADVVKKHDKKSKGKPTKASKPVRRTKSTKATKTTKRRNKQVEVNEEEEEDADVSDDAEESTENVETSETEE